MGLIKQTNAQYYSGEQLYQGANTPSQDLEWPVAMPPLIYNSLDQPNNFKIFVDDVLQLESTYVVSTTSLATGQQKIVFTPANPIPVASFIKVVLNKGSLWDNYRSYAYVTLTDIVNNFMVAYVGLDKLIPRCKRSDIIFHAKRGLQEFSYDTLKSINSQELTIPPNLSLPFPQDYVNYVQLSYVDPSGVKHIIYPTRLTSNPTQPLIQDSEGVPIQGGWGNNLESMQSITDQRWAKNDNLNITGELTLEQIDNYASVYGFDWFKLFLGRRYGLEPEVSQTNGWFTINEREGKFSFSSALVGQLIILEYISDGLAYDMDTKVPKMAEDALYAHISHAILASRSNIPEYLVQRYKRERYSKLRNAKIRLSNIKLEEFAQVMRGKSKWIKH